MKRTYRILTNLILIIAIAALLIPEDGFARRGGGSFRGGKSVSRKSRPATRKSSSAKKNTWGNSKSNKNKSGWNKNGGASKLRNGVVPGSKQDKALYRKASQAGTTFKTRSAAKEAFWKKNGSKYGSKFDKKPASRPDYIPQKYKLGNGREVDVRYNPTYGGYGYLDGGKWFFYNTLADAAMMSMLMNRHNYYYGPPPASTSVFPTVIILVVIAFVVVAVIRLKS